VVAMVVIDPTFKAVFNSIENSVQRDDVKAAQEVRQGSVVFGRARQGLAQITSVLTEHREPYTVKVTGLFTW